MHPDRPAISSHRFTRLVRWAHLWFAACLALVFSRLSDKRRARRSLDAVARSVALLVFVGVAARMPPPRLRARHRHGKLKRRGQMRALVGSRLRRALAGRDPFARLGAMARVLRDLDRHIADLAKRLRLGLTRQRLARFFTDDAVSAAAATDAVCVDTS